MENSEKCCTPLSTNLSPSSCLAEVGNGKDHISFDACASLLRVLVVTKGRPEKSGCKVAKNQGRTEIYLSFQIRTCWSAFHLTTLLVPFSHHHHYYPHFTPDTFAVELQRTVRKLSTVIERCRRRRRSFVRLPPSKQFVFCWQHHCALCCSLHYLRTRATGEKCFQFDGNKIFQLPKSFSPFIFEKAKENPLYTF